jgi:SAM-dependent methyltransferase
VNSGTVRAVTGRIPQPVRFGVRRALFAGRGARCPLCSSPIRGLVGWAGAEPDVLVRRQVVGGVRRAADRCPVCHGVDRTRLVQLYLQRVVGIGERTVRLLHVAPEHGLSLWIRRQPGVDYVPSDLDVFRYRHLPGIREADLTRLPFRDAEFDVVICSHVLEHIPADDVAMAQIRRVLRPTGAALLMVPEALDGGATDEDPAVVDADERVRRFGQWDHVRLYARTDFVARLEAQGFAVESFDPYAAFPEAARGAHLNPLERLHVARPRPADRAVAGAS